MLLKAPFPKELSAWLTEDLTIITRHGKNRATLFGKEGYDGF